MNDSDPPPDSRPPTTVADCDLQLQNPNGYPEARARPLRPWVAPLVAELAPGATSFVVRFVSDREMRRLNRDYRDKDASTDVLSFPGDYAPGDGGAVADPDGGFPKLDHLGDVVISVPTARRQAAAAGHGVDREMRVLVLHGLLHCLGYDHETDDGAMDRLEGRLRRQFIDHA